MEDLHIQFTEPIEHPEKPLLHRLKLVLARHNSDLLIVGETFDERGGLYVDVEVPHAESQSWTWLDWAECWRSLAAEWYRSHEARNRPL